MADWRTELRLMLQQLRRRRWLIVGVAWLVCIIGWIVVTLVPNKYESEALVYVDADGLLNPVLRGIAVDTNPGRHVEFLKRTLLTRPNLERVLQVRTGEAMPDGVEKERAIKLLATEIVVTAQTQNLLAITDRHRDPATAQKTVAALTAIFAEGVNNTNRPEINSAQRFIDEQIASYETQLRAMERRKAEFEQKYINLLPTLNGNRTRLEASRTELMRLKTEAEAARAKRDVLQRELATLPQGTADAASPQPAAGSGDSGGVVSLEQARRNLALLRSRYTDEHPDVVAARRQLAAVQETGGAVGSTRGGRPEGAGLLYAQVRLRLVETESDLAALDSRLSTLGAENASLEETARLAPEAEAQGRDLDRDYAVLKKSYEELLARRESTRLTEAADANPFKVEFRVVEVPQVPILPVSPPRALLVSLVLLVGLAAGTAAPLVWRQFEHSFSTLGQLRALGLPVLGGVSRLPSGAAARQGVVGLIGVGLSVATLFAVYGALMAVVSGLYQTLL